MKKNLFRIVALAFMGAFVASCSSDDELSNEKVIPQPEKDNIVILTGTIGTGMTRSVINESTGAATWSTGDQICIRYMNTSNQYATAAGSITKKKNDDVTATFTATLYNPKATDDIVLVYPFSCYDGSATGYYSTTSLATQDGTLESIGNNCNIQTATGLKLTINGDNTATINNGTSVPLSPKVCIAKITLKDGQGATIFNTNKLTISQTSPSFSCTITPSEKKNVFYVALPEITGTSENPLKISATGPLKYDGTNQITTSSTFRTDDVGKFIVVDPQSSNQAYLAGRGSSSTYSKNYKSANLIAGEFYDLTVNIGQNYTPVAVIAHVGAVTGYWDKFLALALEDAAENGSLASSQKPVEDWVSGHNLTIGINYNTVVEGPIDRVYDNVYGDVQANTNFGTWTSSAPRTTTPTKGWRIPSVTDWRYIFASLCERRSAILPNGIGDQNAKYPNELNSIVGESSRNYEHVANNLLTSIQEKCGGTILSDGYYWTSSELDETQETDNNTKNNRQQGTKLVWRFNFGNQYFQWILAETNSHVRMVFAY